MVCDLIEGEGRQIGIFNVLDDVCATMSAVKVEYLKGLLSALAKSKNLFEERYDMITNVSEDPNLFHPRRSTRG